MSDIELRKGRNCVFLMHVHLVFVTKYRKNIFQEEHLKYLKELMQTICTGQQAILKELDGEHDHIHLLVEYPPKLAISKLVNSLKGVSSRRLRQNFPEIEKAYHKGVLWSPSYFAGSVGGATLEVVKKYIENQRK